MTMTVTPIEATNLSVQGTPANQALVSFLSASTVRQSLLPAYGTQDRERALRRLYRNPHNTIIQGAFAGLASKVVSTPFEISAPTADESANAQDMLRLAHFGKGFEYLFSVTVLNYMRHDRGAWWELIGYGEPDAPMVGSPVAVACLDPLRCYPTGDREYPILYWSPKGALHKMHRTRVYQIVDMPDGDDDYPDTGLCALSRAVAIADREMQMGRYVSARLDDKPKPGLAIGRNLTVDERDAAFARYRAEKGLDDRPEWGETTWFFGVDPREEVKIEMLSFSEAPEKFDYVQYVPLDVKQLALAIGVDIQELWELSGGGIGTGTQSQILAAKSRGKTFGRLLKGIERGMNFYVLPPRCEFSWKYRDPQEDAERAAIASQYAGIAVQLEALIGKRAAIQLLANQVEAFRDVLLDSEGRVRLPDDDQQPQAPTSSIDDAVNTETQNAPAPMDGQQADAAAAPAFKEWSATTTGATTEFVRLVNTARNDEITRRTLTTRLRKWLKDWGEQAYLDGMQEAGDEATALTLDDKAVVQAWLAVQATFTSAFSKEIFTSGLSDMQLASRADAWVQNSLGEIKLKGFMKVKRTAHFKWVVNEAAEHCVSCQRLKGHVHPLSTWVRYNVRPKSPVLQCWIGCKCTLEETNEANTGVPLWRVPLTTRNKELTYPQFIKEWEGQKAHQAVHHAA